jgi:hypothetical protein
MKIVASTLSHVLHANLHMWDKLVVASNKDISNKNDTQNKIAHNLHMLYTSYRIYMNKDHSNIL